MQERAGSPSEVAVRAERITGPMVAGSELPSSQARASRLIAEALVEGHDQTMFVERARSMGLSRGLTDVLLACCPCPVAETSGNGASAAPAHDCDRATP